MSNYFILQNPGCIRVAGDDRRAFFQRQTTNHIDLLRPDRSLLTVLTSPTARILDVLVLLEDGPDLLALTLPGLGTATYRYLRSRVFFMDKVTLSDESAAFAQVDLLDPSAAALEALGFPADAAPAVNGVAAAAGGVRLIRLEPGMGAGDRLLVPIQSLPEIEACLAGAGAAPLSAEAYALRHIEAGLPSSAEWNEDFTPLETGLRAAISDSKGCYTGQEIIARQITYDKVNRRLCGLRLSAPAAAPADLYSLDGAPAGRLTSTAVSPQFGPIALAVVKRSAATSGAVLRLNDPSSNLEAQVVDLPFS